MIGRQLARSRSGSQELSTHRTDEAQSFPRHRPDQILATAAISDRPPSRVDAASERRLGYKASAPDIVDQVVLADHPIAIHHEVHQEIENLGLNGDVPPAAAKFASICVNQMIGKQKLHARALA